MKNILSSITKDLFLSGLQVFKINDLRFNYSECHSIKNQVNV